MNRSGDSYGYEAKCMAYFILEGHNQQQTADEFNTTRKTVTKRLKLIGHTYADLVEIREARKKKGETR